MYMYIVVTASQFHSDVHLVYSVFQIAYMFLFDYILNDFKNALPTILEPDKLGLFLYFRWKFLSIMKTWNSVYKSEIHSALV